MHVMIDSSLQNDILLLLLTYYYSSQPLRITVLVNHYRLERHESVRLSLNLRNAINRLELFEETSLGFMSCGRPCLIFFCRQCDNNLRSTQRIGLNINETSCDKQRSTIG